MQKNKRIPSPATVIALLALCSAPSAWSLGFGNGTPSTSLGRPLDFRVVVRLSEGESLDPACVRASVTMGERAIAAPAVGTVVTTGPGNTAIVTVRTTVRIDEPIVVVDVKAGCTPQVARSFTVFADPPLSPVPVAAEALVSATAASAPSAVVVTQSAAAETANMAAAAGLPSPRPAPQATSRDPGEREQSPPSRQPVKAEPKPKPKPRVTRPRPKVPPPTVSVADSAPRLTLDEPQVSVRPPPAPAAAGPAPTAETLILVDRANEAVKAAIAAASASQARIAALEDSVRQLSAAARDQQQLLAQLSARAEAAEGGARWTWHLVAAVLTLAVLAAWLWLRLRDLERERRQGWLAAARAARTAEASPPATNRPETPTPSRVPLLVERGARHTGLGAVGAGLAPAHQPIPSELPSSPVSTTPAAWHDDDVPITQQTLPLVAMPVSATANSERDVSAEELIDLEQQAEFFVVLGQDDAAIDLLVSHLRDAGGASPLPYLKLLDIYHRRDDKEAYDRTRDRFNQRFNAHAPAWEAAANGGRALEDYPAVVKWLQHVWPQPLDAMAELESLLFRKNGGELFDLPAYRELLLLYALARDLLDATPGVAGSVDVLLPLNDAPGFVPTSPRPYFGDEVPLEDMPATAPLDLDLGPEGPAPVIDRGR